MTTLTITRSMAAERASVWRAFTEPSSVAGWFWPDRFDTRCAMDVVPDGGYRIESTPMKLSVSGRFVVVEPMSRLVYTWRWDADDSETEVGVVFDDAATGGTVLRIEQGSFDTDEERDSHVDGWNSCLDRLPGFLG